MLNHFKSHVVLRELVDTPVEGMSIYGSDNAQLLPHILLHNSSFKSFIHGGID